MINFNIVLLNSLSTADIVVNNEIEDCNKTIYMSKDQIKTVFTSPDFPRVYPDNVNCFTFFVAPVGYRLLVEFEEFVLEAETSCSYDYLEMFEIEVKQQQKLNEQRDKINKSSRVNRETISSQQNGKFRGISNDYYDSAVSSSHQQFEFQQYQGSYLTQQSNSLLWTIFQPSNATYNPFKPPPSTKILPRRICGDWSSKLKLLRHRTNKSLIGFRFHSDYSHHHGGFKAKISIEKGKWMWENECWNPLFYVALAIQNADRRGSNKARAGIIVWVRAK